MTLIERYLKAVAAQLPRDKRDDITAELADEIATRMEAREDSLGRPLTDDEQEAVLREIGHPLSVAARYGSGPQHIVGPELYPWWMFGVKVGLAAVVCLTLLGLVARVLTGDVLAGQAIGQAVNDVFSGAITLIGLATIAAYVLERQPNKPAFLRDWRVKDLGMFEWAGFNAEDISRTVSGGGGQGAAKSRSQSAVRSGERDKLSPTARGVATAVGWTVFLLWWIGLLPNVPTDIVLVDHMVDGIDYGALMSRTVALAHWPVAAYAVAGILSGLFRAWRPEAVRPAAAGDLILSAGRVWACVWLWTVSPFAGLIGASSVDAFARRAQSLFHGDGTLGGVLMLIVAATFVFGVWDMVIALIRLVGGRGAIASAPATSPA